MVGSALAVVQYRKPTAEVAQYAEVACWVLAHFGTVDQFGALVASETKRWGPVIKYTGLKLD